MPGAGIGRHRLDEARELHPPGKRRGKRRVRPFGAEIRQQPHVTTAADPLKTRGQVSRDGRIAFATVQYDQPAMDLGKGPGERLADAAATAERGGIEVSRRGQVVDQAEQQTAPVGELIGIAVAVVRRLVLLKTLSVRRSSSRKGSNRMTMGVTSVRGFG